MEDIKSQKLGAGIIIISIIHFIGAILGIFGTIVLFTQKDKFIAQGVTLTLSNTQLMISLILQIILVIAIIFILFKKAIGVYCYFTITILSIINSIMDTGFQWIILLSLILPILMAICINRKKKLFNF